MDDLAPEDRVRLYYSDIDRGDVPAALAAWHPDVVYRRPGYPPMVGLQEVRRFYDSQRIIASGQHVLHQMVAGDAAVAVRGTFTGQAHDGSALRVGFADFWHFDAGQIRERDTYFDAPAV